VKQKAWILRDNVSRVERLTGARTLVRDKKDHKYWQPSKPYGGATWKDRIRGALLVLFNKATYVRWF
jgi:hypothetical protein